MRKSTILIRDKYGLNQWHDSHVHHVYSYHRLFLTNLIFRGRKATAFRWLCEVKYHLKLREKFDPYLLLVVALMKISPGVILFPIKKSGVVQGAPFPISRRKQIAFAIKWVVKLSKDSNRAVTALGMAGLLADALQNGGDSIAKKNSIEEKAISNKHLVKYYR